MPLPNAVVDLLKRFEHNIEAYRSGQYNETQVRLEFVDPLFKALGWDIHNEKGYAEAYKDVIHEESVKIGGATKAPDYSFRIGGVRKFFVETKKPSINLKEDVSPAYQLRRYAWSAKLPLSILTDFEEFVVYDCRVRPVKTDSAAIARVMYLTYKEYETRWDEIAEIFSHDAVLKGSFDKFAESTKVKKGTAQVDDTFLKEIDSWRDVLARTIALRNPKLTQRELNYAVQVTIDRIIFLRICEDRGIEEYGRLMALQNGTSVYKRLVELFYRADERYNSGLFHFQSETDRSTPIDELTPGLEIDDKVLKDILKRLYYPDSPYEFSVLSADILGQVYEQFLGKVIRLTAGHRAAVEDKPEVKKTGGVYYTPTYIVDYIVKNTVGKLLGKKSDISQGRAEKDVGLLSKGGMPPKQASSERSKTPSGSPSDKLRILDPACGSGSFLLGAYQHLLDWHLQWYIADGPEKHPKELYEAAGGDWRLTTAERKRILLNNIYGVDIDPQAVEVTKLSLLLKVLEGENDQTLSRQIRFFHERALPDLGNNIKCGNSLIGPDFYEGKQLSLLDEEERMRINVFDWEKEFKKIMDVGGFDAVIGNPPYLASYSRESVQMDEAEKAYYQNKYLSISGRVNTFVMFVEKALKILMKSGRLGYIIPKPFLMMTAYQKLRDILLEKTIEKIVLCGEDVFPDANVPSCILITSKVKSKSKDKIEIHKYNSEVELSFVKKLTKDNILQNLEHRINADVSERAEHILTKISKVGVTLGSIASVEDGINPGPFRTQLVKRKKENAKCVKLIEGKNFSRYSPVLWDGLYFLWDKGFLKKIQPKHPNSIAVLGNEARFLEREKIVTRQTSAGITATIDRNQYFSTNSVHTTRLIEIEGLLQTSFLLGVLNSRLMDFFYKNLFKEKEGSFPQVKVNKLRTLPIRTINFSDPADKSRHDRMVALVGQMLELHKQLATAKTEHEKTALQRQIDATDKQIDNLVYELYGLTEEEIKIVENQK